MAPDQEQDEMILNSKNILPIAHPMAPKKLQKRLFKTIKKAAKDKMVKRGVKEVVKALRKKEKGMVVFAGDISPLDVISHIPLICEESRIPYCYVPSKQELGESSQTKRSTSVLMVLRRDSYAEYYDECVKEISGLPVLPSALADLS